VPAFDWRNGVMLAVLMTAAGPLHADYKQDYARGKNAAADQNWAEVESLMRSALAGSSTPLARTRIYGQRFEPYVPQYYLGLAAYRQDDCAQALRWFGDASAAPIIRGNDEFRGIVDQAMQRCKDKIAASKPVPDKPVVNPPVVQPPVAKPPVVATTRPPVATPSKPVTGTTPTVTPPVVAPPIVPSLPRALQGVLDSYLSGRYADAAVADANGLAGNARFHALLLRSAARHQLSLLNSADANNQRAAAEADIRLAKTLSPGKSPDAAFFSPRYRQFFGDVR